MTTADKDHPRGAAPNGFTRPASDSIQDAPDATPAPGKATAMPTEGPFIPPADALAASRRYNLAYRKDIPIIIGVACPRDLTRDPACIIDRSGVSVGQMAFGYFVSPHEDALAYHVRHHLKTIAKAGLDCIVYVAAAHGGAGVVDLCREHGFTQVRRLNGAGPALIKDAYADKRAELWADLKSWLATVKTAAIPDDENLLAEICAPQWSSTGCRADRAGRLMIEAADQIADRLGRYPTAAEALACTFADPIGPGFEGKGPTPVPPQRSIA